ncbi:MAG: acetylxylan esterase [Deltaproteobacteria bacterium]|nr:acetylxylan esterase [Deltaproteobacteria bacterium]
MIDDATFAADPDEPLGLWRGNGTPPPLAPELRAVAFELTSRGDRVPGHVWLPTQGAGPFPTVLLQHGLAGSKDADYIGHAAVPWVRAGAAVVSIDFPLHGARESVKLQELVLAGLGTEGTPTPAARDLVSRIARQAVTDLTRTVDAMAHFPELDGGRLAFAGLSLGAIIGATWCALDPRPRAAALALAGGGFGGPTVDPALRIARIAPRPLLFVNMRDDRTVSAAAAETLFEAAAEPKQIHWFDGDHKELSGRGFKLMWRFLAKHLGIATE